MLRNLPFRPVAITRAALCSVAIALVAAPALAGGDALIEGARLCTQQFPVEEKKNNIPTHLLAAIATTESGRWHDGLGMSVPWPWTINVEGKGYYFNNKAEAIAQTRSFLARGHESIDVGCMQVNLKHHPKAFANLDQAFDPVTNVSYAATFLHDNYATLGDWIKATAAYHSRTPGPGQRYLADIERSWNRIVGKVASARAGKVGDGKPMAVTQTASAAPVVAPQPVGKVMQPAHRARVIQVRDEPQARRASEVMVVRATPAAPQAAPSVAIAEAEINVAPVAAAPAPIPASNSVRRVSLDKATPGSLPVSTPQAAQFVFAN